MELCFQQQKQDFLSLMQLILQFLKCQELIFLNWVIEMLFRTVKNNKKWNLLSQKS